MDGDSVVRRDDNPQAMSTDEFMAQYEVDDKGTYLTNPVGGPIEDQNALKAGERGPSLLEDQIFRRKVSYTHNKIIDEYILTSHLHRSCTSTMSAFLSALFMLVEQVPMEPLFPMVIGPTSRERLS